MNLEEMKSLWAEYDKKLERNWQLNLQLLRGNKLDKAAGQLRKFRNLKLIAILYHSLMAVWLGRFMFEHAQETALLIPAIVVDVLTIIALAWNVYQLALLGEIN